jgi:hypothetical protein
MESDVLECLTKNNPAFTCYSTPEFKGIKLKSTEIPSPPTNLLERIEEIWKEEKRQTPHITNNKIVGVGYIKQGGNYIEMGVSPEEFKWFLTSRLNRVPGYRLDALGGGGITKLRYKGNNFVFFAERGKKTGYIGGGNIETVPQGLMDVEAINEEDPCKMNLLKEYKEEAEGFPKVEEIKYMTIVRNMWGNNVSPTFSLEVNCNGSSNVFSSRKNGILKIKTLNKDETKRRFAVNVSDLEDFIRKYGNDIDWNSRARLKEAFSLHIV